MLADGLNSFDTDLPEVGRWTALDSAILLLTTLAYPLVAAIASYAAVHDIITLPWKKLRP